MYNIVDENQVIICALPDVIYNELTQELRDAFLNDGCGTGNTYVYVE